MGQLAKAISVSNQGEYVITYVCPSCGWKFTGIEEDGTEVGLIMNGTIGMFCTHCNKGT